MEYYWICKKINVIDAFEFINKYGLLEFPCRYQTYCSNCELNNYVSYDKRINGFYIIKEETYKSSKVYDIKGEKNIKKKLLKIVLLLMLLNLILIYYIIKIGIMNTLMEVILVVMKLLL